MDVLGFVFGVFGLMAFLETSSLKGRIDELERQLTRMKGTTYHEDRKALVQAANGYIGKQVMLDLKEDHEDLEIMNYGNTKNGSITILDGDEEWLLVRIESKKGTVTKLIRMESVERISSIV